MIAWLGARFGKWLAAIGGGLLAIGGVWLAGRSAGKRDSLERNVEAGRRAREIDDDVRATDPDKARKELESWSRD